MTVLAWITMDRKQRDAAEALSDENVVLGAREVSNPLANNLGYGQLLGAWVSPARLLNDPLYTRWVPTLGQFPIHVMDSETLFVPDEI